MHAALCPQTVLQPQLCQRSFQLPDGRAAVIPGPGAQEHQIALCPAQAEHGVLPDQGDSGVQILRPGEVGEHNGQVAGDAVLPQQRPFSRHSPGTGGMCQLP